MLSFLMILLGQKRLRMTPFADFVSESYSLFYYSGEVTGGRVYDKIGFVGVIGGK